MGNSNQSNKTERKVVGLIPAAGKGTRLAPLPFSKELYPIGFQHSSDGTGLRPKPICLYLLEKMRFAGITEAYIVLRNGKWDIPAYLRDGSAMDMQFAYLIMNLPFGVPYTVDQAYPFIQNKIVAFGFPDIIFQSQDAFKRLLRKQADTQADIVLGLFPVDRPHKWDVVELSQDGQIKKILIKPPQSELGLTWILAVWTPVFTHFMHEYLGKRQKDFNRKVLSQSSTYGEVFMSEVIQAALDDQLKLEGVVFKDRVCIDIGTPEGITEVLDEKIWKDQ